MGFLGGQEILLILLIVALLFGGKKIPELAKGLGNGIKEFKNATKDADKELRKEDSEKKNGNGTNT